MNMNMMNTSTERSINPDNLNDRQYTVSLLQEALRAGILQQSESQRIQIRLVEALDLLIQEYTDNQSSSVSQDIGRKLFGSLLYGLDLWLLQQPSYAAAIEKACQIEPAEMIRQSRQAIADQVDTSRVLLQQVKANQIEVELISYQELIEQFTNCLKQYDGRFDAAGLRLSIDYPLLSDDMRQTGIIYVRNYLQHLWLENLFCSHFRPAAINRLLQDHGRKYAVAGSELLVNLVELILNQALASVLLGRSDLDLALDEQDCLWLEMIIQNGAGPTNQKRQAAALEAVLTVFQADETAAAEYLRPFATECADRLFQSAFEGTLSAYLTISRHPETRQLDSPDQGQKLTDSSLRLFLDYLSEIDDLDARINLILKVVRHPDDLAEILGAACFQEHELFSLFARLGDYELAVLSKPLIDHSPLSPINFNDIGQIHRTINEIPWQAALSAFLKALDLNRQAQIADWIQRA